MNIVNLRAALRPICDQVWPREKVSDAPVFVWDNYESACAHHDAFDRNGVRDMITTPEHRFGRNVGKIIDVASSWVGPKEWQGTDGKVYAVIERKVRKPAALPRLAA